MTSRLLLLSLAAAASFMAVAQRPPAANRSERTREFLGLPPPPDAAAAERGEKVYQSNCAFCHGAKANGAEGPDLVRSALVLHDENGNLIAPVVSKGRPDRGMPAFNFSPQQLSDIAAFLHMRVYAAANRGTYKLLNVVTGDAAAGQAYFNGAGHCNTCHSPTGDLAGIATKFSPADLQAQFLYPGDGSRIDGARTRREPTAVTVTLPSGETIKGTLKSLDDFDVSMFDGNGIYHSWPRDAVKIEVEDRLAAHRQLLGQYSDEDMHNLLAYLETLK